MKAGELYEFIVVAVDGDTMQESDVVEIEASSTGIYLIIYINLSNLARRVVISIL